MSAAAGFVEPTPDDGRLLPREAGGGGAEQAAREVEEFDAGARHGEGEDALQLRGEFWPELLQTATRIEAVGRPRVREVGVEDEQSSSGVGGGQR